MARTANGGDSPAQLSTLAFETEAEAEARPGNRRTSDRLVVDASKLLRRVSFLFSRSSLTLIAQFCGPARRESASASDGLVCDSFRLPLFARSVMSERKDAI